MVITVAFSNIGYQTYVIFAVINGALLHRSCPETAYRNLEEMDRVFLKTKGLRS